MVLHVLLRGGLLEHFEPAEREARGDIRIVDQADLLGVLRDELDAHQVFLDLLTIFGRQLAQRPAGQGERVVLVELLADGLAVHGHQRRLGRRCGHVGGLVGGGGLGAGGERKQRTHGHETNNFHLISQQVEGFSCLGLSWDLGRSRVDRQRVDVAAHQFSGGSIDHPVPFQRGDAGKARRRDHDVEMAAFASTGVAGVFRAVVANLEQGRVQGGLERCPQAVDARTGVTVPIPSTLS